MAHLGGRMRKLVTGKLTDDSDQKAPWRGVRISDYWTDTTLPPKPPPASASQLYAQLVFLPHPFICEFAFSFSCRAAH